MTTASQLTERTPLLTTWLYFFNQLEDQLAWGGMELQSEKRGMNREYKKVLPISSAILSPFTLPWVREVNFPHIFLLSSSSASLYREVTGTSAWNANFSSSFSLVQELEGTQKAKCCLGLSKLHLA